MIELAHALSDQMMSSGLPPKEVPDLPEPDLMPGPGIEEPDPDLLPDEIPNPNPDENSDPPMTM